MTRNPFFRQVGWGLLLLGLVFSSQPKPAAATELPRILQRGYLIVAVKDNLNPLGFRDSSGQLQGLEIDLARRLAQDWFGQADAVVLKPVTNRDRLPLVVSGEVDLAIANLTVTDNRLRVVQFSEPYARNGTSILTRDSTLHTLSDLAHRRIGVLQGSVALPLARSALPASILVGLDAYTEAKTSLEAGELDAFVGDTAVLIGWTRQDPTYRRLAWPLAYEQLAIALPKGLQHESLRQRLNQSLKQWQQEEWLQARLKYWGLAL